MEVDGFVTDACPQCIRLRNYVEYGKNVEKNPKAVDYMKVSYLFEKIPCIKIKLCIQKFINVLVI